MRVNGVGSQNFNGLLDHIVKFCENVEEGTRYDAEVNPLTWLDSFKRDNPTSYDVYEPKPSPPVKPPVTELANEASLRETVKSLGTASTSAAKKELLLKIRGSVDNMLKSIK